MICTFVQKVLDDIAANDICDPFKYDRTDVGTIFHSTGDVPGRCLWRLSVNVGLFFPTLSLNRGDIGREYDGVNVRLTGQEKRALWKAISALEKAEKARRKALKERARRWP